MLCKALIGTVNIHFSSGWLENALNDLHTNGWTHTKRFNMENQTQTQNLDVWLHNIKNVDWVNFYFFVPRPERFLVGIHV